MIYASDEDHLEDYFQLEHEKNKGKCMTHNKKKNSLTSVLGKHVEMGDVVFNITHLEDSIRRYNKTRRERVNCVTLRVEVKIAGRSLEFIARWPPRPDGQIVKGSRRYFSVAGALPVSAT